eukprot:CAMPEP_0203888942 /NCGR_PEP_ID=MMETSP0359-20131031/32545_1 /ASSEMBLY_ACC=CAM_ASM_000338 /TAXON_ID=268821 /ORGANISM="Scrippsiella Hangoei, Strain SHTV-5" /LENGTH=414 /DNA_ID=CAMNT_0050810251 /DNA_START=6 /DNA_END=1246 /DNA_ORIENTATION=+
MSQMRFLWYPEVGGSLPQHVDLPRNDVSGRRSTYTFLLYLQDCDHGGETNLLECLDGDVALADSGGVAPGSREVLARIQPRRGRLLLLPHICPHSASPVLDVPKVLLRGEVLPPFSLLAQRQHVSQTVQAEPVAPDSTVGRLGGDRDRQRKATVAIGSTRDLKPEVVAVVALAVDLFQSGLIPANLLFFAWPSLHRRMEDVKLFDLVARHPEVLFVWRGAGGEAARSGVGGAEARAGVAAPLEQHATREAKIGAVAVGAREGHMQSLGVHDLTDFLGVREGWWHHLDAQVLQPLLSPLGWRLFQAAMAESAGTGCEPVRSILLEHCQLPVWFSEDLKHRRGVRRELLNAAGACAGRYVAKRQEEHGSADAEKFADARGVEIEVPLAFLLKDKHVKRKVTVLSLLGGGVRYRSIA